MKYFRHYKNQPYKYVGVAKHSETLEDLVIYETRYTNETAKVWVRPKKMFFESVEVAGKSTPRFAEIKLEIKAKTEVTLADVQVIGAVMEKAFGEFDPNWFASTFKNHTKYYLLLGYVEDQPIGFKLGYETKRDEFHSWIGGVLPELHGLGVAADLMAAQHEWCIAQGYKKIQTTTYNRFRQMLLLNIRFGFDIIGYQMSDYGPKIILEKNLLERNSAE